MVYVHDSISGAACKRQSITRGLVADGGNAILEIAVGVLQPRPRRKTWAEYKVGRFARGGGGESKG